MVESVSKLGEFIFITLTVSLAFLMFAFVYVVYIVLTAIATLFRALMHNRSHEDYDGGDQ